jgi:hypothetical protein
MPVIYNDFLVLTRVDVISGPSPPLLMSLFIEQLISRMYDASRFQEASP